MSVSEDARWMRRALALATRGLRTCPPNPAVGCVLVKDGQRIGEGWHRRAGGAHAEAVALRAAGNAARGACAYVTLEPCDHHGRTPPCAPALVTAGITRVVVATTDPNPLVAGRGLARLRQAGLAVETGVVADLARRLNRGYFSRYERGRPWLVLKLAASLDGRVALGNGTSRWISGPVARAAVQRRRARAGAILAGVGTVLADDPALSVRLPGIERQPMRIILDSRLRTASTARLFAGGGPIHIFCVEASSEHRTRLEGAGARVHCIEGDSRGRPRLEEVLEALGKLEINDVYAECGPVLAGALIQNEFVDELELFFGPQLFGPAARPLAMLADLQQIPDPPRLRVEFARRAGRDIRVRLTPVVCGD